ncbi:MAG: ATP-dependent Clp protease adaptor ClpS [Sandaracinaceae bacterium]|nr:ATP-dependent Clp protease adaptor ClpS [Sandaracinaceae bacterium]MCC6874613.1 ATP-dependent Clp protease adaptor ClpS [Sandaracinaceae bacterium]
MSEKYESDGGTVTETRTERRVKRPRMYRVLLHNDDYTTREFVVEVLRAVFHHSETEAVRIMLHVHHNGVGVAGVFTREVAETKTKTVEQLAREHEYPLRVSMEPEEDDDGSEA